MTIDPQKSLVADEKSSKRKQQPTSHPTRWCTTYKIVTYQLTNFRRSKDNFYEFEHLLFNHLRPHEHRIKEENKLHYFQSLLRDEAIGFFQPQRNNSDTTLRDFFIQLQQELARVDFEKVYKNR